MLFESTLALVVDIRHRLVDSMAESGENGPLPLSDLKRWMLEDTYAWLETADKKEAAFKQEMEDNGTESISNLFGDDDSEDLPPIRVQEWTSSRTNVDGTGGIIYGDGIEEPTISQEEEEADHRVSIVFILSESWDGFGDTLWASARHVANELADAEKCRELLAPLMKHRGDVSQHPLIGTSFLELGAGAGVPSWTAMQCGARVVSTDQSVANRIRCMAECVERNQRKIKATLLDQDSTLLQGGTAKVCPYDWGKSIDGVARALSSDGKERFDVIVAADCCYMPWCHVEMLDSIDMLMTDRGVCLIFFALHGNTDDADVWGIVERAKNKDFQVDHLKAQQLIPPKSSMEAKQGLVHTLRLSRQ